MNILRSWTRPTCDRIGVFRHLRSMGVARQESSFRSIRELTERLLDLNGFIGQRKKITMIFGPKVTKEYKGKLQTVIEDLDLPNPVIRSHYGHGFATQYVRDARLLRTEPATNNVYDYGVNKDVENLPQLRERMSKIIDNYHNVQQDILETFIDRGQLRRLAEPTILPSGKRIPGSSSITRDNWP
jgi:hypothetical protein